MKIPTISRLAVLLTVILGIGVSAGMAQFKANTRILVTLDARTPSAAPESGYLRMGSSDAQKSPAGHVLSVNSRYLTMDGKPWLPIMGEFHYTRYPERYWEEELLKMKAGGIQIVSTYVFWIHHEEEEGRFDWSGQRDLRKFVELCAKHGLYVYPRIGPWAHGEVRNGGLPDWLIKKSAVRVNDPTYLSYARRYYDEVGRQLRGLLWKDGGPIIGIQLENEYADRGPNGGAAHIATLKSMAIEAGLDVPLYTVTGWDNAVYPPRDVIPVFGGYADEFWPGGLQDLRPDPEGVYQFDVAPAGGNVGILQGTSVKSDEVQLWHYPRFTAELGGGMQVAYHRRPVISEDDIAPPAITRLGSGVNLLGYYMFQGGINPPGKLTTLQESQATNYSSDLPVKSYDFQAPLSAFGQLNGSFRQLKVVHQFIQDFGSDLASMTAVQPSTVPSSTQDTTIPRVVARTRGDSGYLFFNNYLRNHPLPEHKDVQVELKLPSETISVPREPFTLPSQSTFFWPIGMDLGGARLKYATAQPFAKIDDEKVTYYFFTACAGIAPEFAFESATISKLNAPSGAVSREGDRVYIGGLTPSTRVAVEIQTHAGRFVRIVLLSQTQAQNSWKLSIGGRERLLVTSADVFTDGDNIFLRSRNVSDFSVSMFPEGNERLTSTMPLKRTGHDGAFVHYAVSVKPKTVVATIEKVRDAQASSPVKMGKYFDWRGGSVATVPDDSDFAKAAVWRLTFPKGSLEGLSDAFLDINYVGDVGRLLDGTELLDDNFFNGTSWEVGLKRFAPAALKNGLELQVLPLRKDAPIYMPGSSWPKFDGRLEATDLKSVKVTPEYEVKLTLQR